jgi:hypothetical protein
MKLVLKGWVSGAHADQRLNNVRCPEVKKYFQ